MKRIILSFAVISVVSLSGCETGQFNGTKQTVGTGVGAVIGGYLGSKVGGGSGQLWATGAGALLGALAGSEVGKSLDKADLMYANKAQSRAHTAPIGETITWNNPDSGHSGSIVPTKDGYSNSGNYCREYRQTIIIDGKEEVGYGTACQLSDGTWEII